MAMRCKQDLFEKEGGCAIFHLIIPLEQYKLNSMQTFLENNAMKRKPRAVPTFLKKTYELLNNEENSTTVKWASNGIGFLVLDEEAFSREVLPKYFKHNKYTSFVRQLNMYNFHKIRESSIESYFHHECFDRANEQKMSDIKRKPENKKRKDFEEEEGSSNEEESLFVASCQNNSQRQNDKGPTKMKQKRRPKTDYAKGGSHTEEEKQIVSIHLLEEEVRKVESQKNTHHMFSSEFKDSLDSQRLVSMQIEQERPSINNEYNEGIWLTRELIYPSYCNLLSKFGGQSRVEQFALFH